MKKMIAIVGMAGSGKSIASSYLEEKGYQKIYFGGAIYQKMKEENIEITPESQKEYREEIRKKYEEAKKERKEEFEKNYNRLD